MLRIYKWFELLWASSWLEKAMQGTLPTVFCLSLDLSGCLFLPQLLPNMHRQLLEMLHVLPKTAEGARGSGENANRKE